MSIQFSRRHLLSAIPVAGLVMAAGQGQANETPIAQLFRQWKALTARIEDPAISDEECDAVCDQRSELEKLICVTAAVTVSDVLMKICAVRQFGVFGGGSEWENAAWREAQELLGG